MPRYRYGAKFQSTLPARGATLPASTPVGRTARISIYAPRTGSDILLLIIILRGSPFQSTLPARGATPSCRPRRSWRSDFNPRSPHGERPCPARCPPDSGWYFNPRSPHGERHFCVSASNSAMRHFNPRSPHGERQDGNADELYHAHFNPRSPHGERPCRRISPC